mmetsp:Transcript_53322/g.152858  ORF Transcript_53322/g.152858 Transcript_53322/m.152858 type:complete len:231 (-) Transcript_53322:102-794(-)
MAPKRNKFGMSKDEAMTRIKDIEDPMFADHLETYNLAVRGMTDNLKDHEVQRKGVWALALGAITQPRYLIQAGAVEMTIKSMAQWPLDERLQADGCECLRILCSKSEGMRLALAAGGIQSVFNALQQHSEDNRVQQEACGALSRFSQKDTQAVLAKGGYENILHTMDLFANYSWVQMWVCQATKQFSKLDPKRVEGIEGYSKIQATMKAHEASEGVQVFGREALMTRPVP